VTESAPRRFDRGAFFDVDGTLVSTNVVDAYAYYVFHRGTIFGTAQRLIRGLALAPIYAIAERVNRKVFNELFYRAYRGLSEDRLIELSQDLCDKVLKPAVYPGALDIIAECRKAGCKFVEGFATGKVIPPIVEGANKANRVREYCVRHGLRLDLSHAYSDSLSDYPMLTVVGRPTVVNPDRRLRSHARAYEWPILDLTLTGRRHLPR